MLFSIITITKDNSAEFLRTYQSIIAQNFPYELIVQDGSIDEKYTDKLPKSKNHIIIRAQDDGIYDAMNQAIQKTRGKFIIFMNSGDVFFREDILEKVSQKIDASREAVYFGDHFLDGGDRGLIKKLAKPSWQINFRMPFSHQSCFVSSSLLKRNKFCTGVGSAADYGFFLTLYDIGYQFIYLNLYVSVIDTGGVSNTNRLASIISRIKIVQRSPFFFQRFMRFAFNISAFSIELMRLLIRWISGIKRS